jgi:uncharacterized protein
MKTQTKALAPFEVKATDDASLTFEGLSSTWDLDLGGDVIQRGAFARTLDHWRSSSKIIPLIDQHNYGSVRAVVGKMTDARETDEGLWTSWEILDTDDGREVYARLKGGYIDGLSIGYRVIGDAPIENGVRMIKEVALEEVSAVIWPMNPGARVMAVKAALEHMTDEERKEIGVLTEEPAPAVEADPEPEGLAPDDPARLTLESTLRDVLIRSLASRTDGSTR